MDTNSAFYITQSITLLLLILSEYLGITKKYDANSVLQIITQAAEQAVSLYISKQLLPIPQRSSTPQSPPASSATFVISPK